MRLLYQSNGIRNFTSQLLSFSPSKLWLSPAASVQWKTLEAWSLEADPIRYSLPMLKKHKQTYNKNVI